MTTKTKPVTAEELLNVPDDGFRYELVDPERRSITVYRSRENIRILPAEAGDVADGAGVVTGWRLSLAELFAQG